MQAVGVSREVAIVLIALAGFATSSLLVPLIQRHLRAPVGRQLHHTHDTPISRFGGLALAVPFLVVTLFVLLSRSATSMPARERWVILLASLAMFLLGFIDDARPLGAKRKLIGQGLIASAVYCCGIQIATLRNPLSGVDYALDGWSFFVTVFWLVAFTNLLNLIDGVDGLAGGIALMVMGLLLYAGFHLDLFCVACAAAVFGALLGFLRHNFPPASIYLGDGGAYFLGFLIGLLAMVCSQKGTVAAALIAPLFALALPIVDVALVIVRRGLKGIPIFRPDRRHLHHRLMDAGLSRTQVLFLFHGLSVVFLVLAFAVFVTQGRWVPILFGAGCLVLLVTAHSFSFSREWFAVGKVLSSSLAVRKRTRYALAMSQWFELGAERCVSSEELWTDFQFIARKLGFHSATLITTDGRAYPSQPAEDHGNAARSSMRKHCLLHHPTLAALDLTGTAEPDLKTFDLLTELAAETLLKAVTRWERKRQAQFEVGAKADTFTGEEGYGNPSSPQRACRN